MDQSSISIPQFINARLSEIGEFTSKLESKYLNCNKQPYQLLHKHLRRRPMSHNRYRIPSSLRKQMNVNALKQCEDSQKIIRCRKHIRKQKLLMQIYRRRSNKVQWLETHIHQAKRMKMITHFNYKVAYQANEKNFRAVHRYEDHGTCIFDASYYIPLQIEQLSENVELFLSQYTDSKLPLSPQIYQEVCIKSIGYALLLQNPTSKQILLFIHPGMLQDMENLFKMLQIPIISKQNEFCVFQMFGPQSYYYIQDLLKKWNYNFGLQTSANHLYYSIELQKEQKVQSYTRQDYKLIKTLDDYPQEFNFNVQYSQQDYQVPQQSIWNNIQDQNSKDKEQMKRFKIVTRSRYTHRKKDKLKYQKDLKDQKQLEKSKKKEKKEKKEDVEKKEKIKEMDDENEKKAIKWILRQKDKFIQANQMEQPMQLQENKKDDIEFINLLVMSPLMNCTTSIGLGYKIIINLGQGEYIWKQFYQMKVKPIGIRDVKQIALENQLRYFPDDFPQTNAGKVQINEEISQKIDSELKMPPAKRHNHFLLRFPYPIQFPYEQYDVSCFIFGMKSIPKNDALILKPREDDYDRDEIKIEIEKNRETVQKNDCKKKEEFQVYLDQLSKVECSREIIGRVSYGNSSLKYGVGMGHGLLRNNFKEVKDEFLVLFQNVGSCYLYFGNCKVKN